MNHSTYVTFEDQYKFLTSGTVCAKSPSNIALVKYWGKREPQIPMNASISYTLTHSFSQTEMRFTRNETHEHDVVVYLKGKETPEFIPKIQKFLERIKSFVPFVTEYNFEIHTENSFPHSSGIASSASGMSALACCFVQMEEMFGVNFTGIEKLQKSSFLARLGSGSACRSLYPGLVVWGENDAVPGSSDLYAIPYAENVNEVFKDFYDTILLIHEGTKGVSSTAGHNLMHHHPYAPVRFEQAQKNLASLTQILAEGDLARFGGLIEHEALSLHAMMMTSCPSYILMKPNTIAVIDKIWKFRKETKTHVYFTLDAGANVHVLYPGFEAEKVKQFIEESLLPYCQNGKAVWDKVAF